jgi:hypothetical protein
MRVFTLRLLETLRERLLKKIAAAPSLGFMYKFNPKVLDERAPDGSNHDANITINRKNAFIREYIKNHLHLPAYNEAGASDKLPYEELDRMLTGFYSSHDGSPGYITQHPRRANLNRNAKFSVLYVLATISKRNAEILLELRKLLKSVETEIKHLDHNFMVYLGMKTRKEIFNPFTKAIQLFVDVSNLSDIVVPDFEHPMSHYLSVEIEKSPSTGVFSKVQVIKPESETLSVPMSAIQLALEECFGVHVPGIPLIQFTGSMASNKGKWMRIISAAGQTFREEESVRIAIHSYMAKARRELAWVRRGGRVEIL